MSPARAIIVCNKPASFGATWTVLKYDFDISDVIYSSDLAALKVELENQPGLTLVILDAEEIHDNDISLTDLRRDFADILLVVLTRTVRAEEVLALLAQGVHGVLTDTMTDMELLQGLSLILAGLVFVPTGIVVAQHRDLERSIRAAASSVDMRNGGRGGEVCRDKGYTLLTSRQREMLNFLMEGHSNKAIALKLDLTESTVKHHVSLLLKNLGFQNRLSAAVWMVRRNCLSTHLRVALSS